MMQRQNYVMKYQEYILMNTMMYQKQKEKNKAQI